jgi:hypothetical protein
MWANTFGLLHLSSNGCYRIASAIPSPESVLSNYPSGMSDIFVGKKRSNEFRFRQDSAGFPRHRNRRINVVFQEVLSFHCMCTLHLPLSNIWSKVGQFQMFGECPSSDDLPYWQLIKFPGTSSMLWLMRQVEMICPEWASSSVKLHRGSFVPWQLSAWQNVHSRIHCLEILRKRTVKHSVTRVSKFSTESSGPLCLYTTALKWMKMELNRIL